MIPRDISQVAEDAIRLMSTYYDTSGVGREGAARHAVVGVASAAEAYVDSVLSHLMLEFAAQSGPPGMALVKNAQKEIDRSWAQRGHWLSATLSLNLGNEGSWNQLTTLIDLRNAIAHGTGGLSPVQNAKGQEKFVKEFREIFRCQYADQRLILPHEAVDIAIRTGRGFVLWLDAEAVNQSETLRNAVLR